MRTDSNPYQSPHTPTEPPAPERSQSRHVAVSIFMIGAGAFFCVASFYVILGHGVEALVTNYRTIGVFPFAFMVFYGGTSGLTSLFHLSYLLVGRPQQHLAGAYAIVLGLALAGIAIAAMEAAIHFAAH